VEWYDLFQPSTEDGSALKREDHPIQVALRRQEPSYRSLVFQGLDGVRRRIRGTAFPILGQCRRHLGAAGFFWEDPE